MGLNPYKRKVKPVQNTDSMIDRDYIQKAIEDKMKVILYLINGVSLKGTILNQDDDCIVMTSTLETSATKTQLVYKNAISTIVK
jgi:RNA chaperone Hfq